MAMTAETPSAAGVRWDLSDLFAGPDDPALPATLEEIDQRARAFAARYRGTVNTPDGPAPDHLLTALREWEDLAELMERVEGYAHLLYAAQTDSQVARNLMEQVDQRLTAARNEVLFFELEWLALPNEVAERVAAAPELAPYRDFLRRLRRYRPHTLSEPEEKIINEKDRSGVQAWQRLFTEMTAALRFTLEVEGVTRTLPLDGVLALQRHPDRETRRRAYETLYARLAEHGELLTFIYDTVILDHLTMQRLRRYPDPMAPRHLANRIDGAVVEQMLRVVEANYPLAHRYFTLKARLLALPKLALFDQYAPVGTTRPVTYQEAREAVLTAFAAFHPTFLEIARTFFEKNWIDAEPRPGKRGGAFCASLTPRLHPYILLNYNDTARDAMTLAHELGHGLHGMLARRQSLVNYHPPLTLAETASVFAEILVFDRLLAATPEPAAQLGLLCGKIEEIFATVFRQTVLTRFEQAAFAARDGRRLAPDQVGDLWLQANAPYYGPAVEVIPSYRWGWSYIPHFIHTPFYCYSYVFGELLVLSLYAQYRREGAAFIPRYLALLEAGGSAPPEDLLAPLGVDLRSAAFWQQGFDELAALVARAEETAARLSVAGGPG